MTLKDYLAGQHAPPEIQEKLEALFALPEQWRALRFSSTIFLWLAEYVRAEECANELEAIVLK